ncbi:MAG TPA: VWA domain-containing protein [Candidatus Acidoferrales bacterium]|nr:VWA domain-containing protein [Candidatus Acidoferrales bacterium]
MLRARDVAMTVMAVAMATAVRGQAPPGPMAPPGHIQEAPKPSVRVNVDWVSTPVTVRNGSGELVLNLSQNDFHVMQDGVEQKIEHFDLGGDPLSVVVVVENSSRVEALLPAVRKTGILLSQDVMPGDVRAALVSYDDRAEIRQPWTTSGDAMERAMNKLPTGLSGAALYDALSKGVDLLSREPRTRRRVILAMAEPVDTGSETRFGEVLRAAQQQNVTIYSVGLSTTAAELRGEPRYRPSPYPPGISPMPGPPGIAPTPEIVQNGSGGADLGAVAIWIVQHVKDKVKENVLKVAAAGTGGENISGFKDRTIEKSLSTIAGELHAQYTLGYRPAEGNQPGFHKIEVSVDRGGLNVRARPGYYLE